MIGRRTHIHATATPALRQRSATFRALRHRNFRLFWFGQLVSLIGTWMQSLALQWLVYKITGSPLAMGTVLAMQSLPVLVLSPFAGVLVDRWSKRNVIIGTQTMAMLLALVLAALTFLNLIQYWQIIVMSLGVGLINAVDMPCRQAFLSEMVPDREDLMNAIALNSSVFNAARVIGPAVAGILVGAVGLGWAFTLNSISFLAVIGGLLLMSALPDHRAVQHTSPLREFRDGVHYAISSPVIRMVLILVLVPSIFGFAYVTLLPIFADQILVIKSGYLANGATRLGVLMMVNGAGALSGALAVARMSESSSKRQRLLNGALGFGIGVTLLAFNRSFWLALPIVFVMGYAMITFLATANTTLQTNSSDGLRGRVMSFYVQALVGMGLVGSVLAGFIAEHWGAPAAVAVGGGACIIAAVAATRSKALREIE